jgi:hypothetical protein
MIVLTVGPASLARLMRRDGTVRRPPAPTADTASEGDCGRTGTFRAPERR